MSELNETIKTIFEQSDGMNSEEALKEVSLLIALSKRDKYRMECQHFEKKYKMNLNDFEKHLHTNSNAEDYDKENDLDDWEFAVSSLNWWQKRIEELLNDSN
ncbi:MAG: hypothetical protein GF353_20250 [Candidatus Lokiarchaeota archaeon]|nr:hypothetical protein [Candidatus Lokiarchaeota archaeon]